MKKVTMILAVAAMMFAVSACGNNKKGEATEGTECTECTEECQCEGKCENCTGDCTECTGECADSTVVAAEEVAE